MFEAAGLLDLPTPDRVKKSTRNGKQDTYRLPLWTMQNVYSQLGLYFVYFQLNNISTQRYKRSTLSCIFSKDFGKILSKCYKHFLPEFQQQLFSRITLSNRSCLHINLIFIVLLYQMTLIGKAQTLLLFYLQVECLTERLECFKLYFNFQWNTRRI